MNSNQTLLDNITTVGTVGDAAITEGIDVTDTTIPDGVSLIIDDDTNNNLVNTTKGVVTDGRDKVDDVIDSSDVAAKDVVNKTTEEIYHDAVVGDKIKEVVSGLENNSADTVLVDNDDGDGSAENNIGNKAKGVLVSEGNDKIDTVGNNGVVLAETTVNKTKDDVHAIDDTIKDVIDGDGVENIVNKTKDVVDNIGDKIEDVVDDVVVVVAGNIVNKTKEAVHNNGDTIEDVVDSIVTENIINNTKDAVDTIGDTIEDVVNGDVAGNIINKTQEFVSGFGDKIKDAGNNVINTQGVVSDVVGDKISDTVVDDIGVENIVNTTKEVVSGMGDKIKDTVVDSTVTENIVNKTKDVINATGNVVEEGKDTLDDVKDIWTDLSSSVSISLVNNTSTTNSSSSNLSNNDNDKDNNINNGNDNDDNALGIFDACGQLLFTEEPKYFAPFQNTKPIVSAHTRIWRGGHTNDILDLVTGNKEEAVSYVTGIVVSAVTVFIVFLSWMVVLLTLKAVGRKRVGLWSGRRTALPPKLQNNKNKNKNKNTTPKVDTKFVVDEEEAAPPLSLKVIELDEKDNTDNDDDNNISNSNEDEDSLSVRSRKSLDDDDDDDDDDDNNNNNRNEDEDEDKLLVRSIDKEIEAEVVIATPCSDKEFVSPC